MSQYQKIAVLAAMSEELECLRPIVKVTNTHTQGKAIVQQAEYQGRELLLVESGIGKCNAAIATTLLIERFSPDLIINIGSAGALVDELKIADVVVGSDFMYADVDATCFGYIKGQLPQMPATFGVNQQLLNSIKEELQQAEFDFAVKFGQILTSDAFIEDWQLQQKRRADFPAGLVAEMESAAVAHAASFYPQVDVLAFRAVSDIAGRQAAASFEENLAKAVSSVTDFLLFLLKRLGQFQL